MKTYDYTKLKRLREDKNLTQEQMSALVHMTQSNYCKLEKGQRKIKALDTLEKIAAALDMPLKRLTGILSGEDATLAAGMKNDELRQVEDLLTDKPLREDEYIFCSAEILDVEKYDLKEHYSGLNLKDLNEDDPFPMHMYPPDINVIVSSEVEIGTNALEGVSIWLGDKKLGTLDKKYYEIIDPLIMDLKISRAVLIGNEDSIAGYFDTYMKVVFIGTNAVCKSGEFDKGRFKSLRLLTKEEIEEIDNENS